jgi:CheY-like chemotaxis protein
VHPLHNVRARVLLVDDNADSTEVLAQLLESYDIAAATAATGAQAMQRAVAETPRVIVLDLGLPDMDGYALLEHLRQLEALRDTTFVALTGRGLPEDLARMREAGFDHHFLKPVAVERFVALLREELRNDAS